MHVDLPTPEQPFAAADDFRRARAVLEQWSASSGERGAVIREGQQRGRLPFLGAVGAYSTGGYDYRLMSTRASGRHAYDLRRQPTTGDRLVWRSGVTTVGERCAMVWADELHHAVAQVATDLLNAGISDRPRADVDADYAPVLPIFRRRRKAIDPLADETAALEKAQRAREMAFDMLSDPIGDPEEYRAEVRLRLAKAEGDIASIRARIAEIEAAQAHTSSNEDSSLSAPHAHTFSSELEGLLLVVQRLRGHPLVPGGFADGVQEWLRVRVERTNLRWVHFSVELTVPGPGDSVLTLGPGHGRVAARGKVAPVAGGKRPATSRTESLERYEEARSADVVEQMMANGTDLVSLLPPPQGADTPTSAWGRTPRLNAAAHLADLARERGFDVGPKVAAVALRNPLPAVRLAIWRALHGQAPPAVLDAHFAAYVARAYLGSTAAPAWADGALTEVARGDTGAWAHHHVPTATLMAHLAQQPGGEAPTTEVKRIVADSGGKPNTIAHMLGGTARTGPLLERRLCGRDDCNPNCRRHGRIGLRACPHEGCSGWLDTPARIFEVPDGVLCSRCQRMPHPASPVFPREYLTAAERHLDSLMLYAPDVLAQRVRSGRRVPGAWLARKADVGNGEGAGAA